MQLFKHELVQLIRLIDFVCEDTEFSETLTGDTVSNLTRVQTKLTELVNGTVNWPINI